MGMSKGITLLVLGRSVEPAPDGAGGPGPKRMPATVRETGERGFDGGMTSIDTNAALVIIDVQQGFDESEWGSTTNLGCEANIDALATAWISTGRPIVVVRHDSKAAGSSLHPGKPGNALKPSIAALPASLLVTKNVNSAFIGDPDLHQWLGRQGIHQLVICGIQTNMCVETTARMGGNLGYDVIVPLDATRTFGLVELGPRNGAPLSATADEVMRMTALNLAAGGFATVTSTAELLPLV